MAIEVTSYEQLILEMEKIVEEVIASISDELLKELKEKILLDTYGSHGLNKIYNSSYVQEIDKV